MGLPLATLAQRWNEKLRLASKKKEKRFGKYAREAMRFYSEPHDFYFDQYHAKQHSTTEGYEGFKATNPLVSNLVQVYLPFLYPNNHYRTFNPRRPATPPGLLEAYQFYKQQQAGIMAMPQPPQQGPSPVQIQDELRSRLLEAVLNTTPEELNLKGNSREGIVEGLIKGRAVMWTEIIRTAFGELPGSTYVSVDDLFVDPDAKRLVDAKWIARRRRRPVRETEQFFGLKRGSLKGDDYSNSQKAEINTDDESLYENQCAGTADLITYYEIYSRIGLGSKLRGAVRMEDDNEIPLEVPNAIPEQIMTALEQFGDDVYLAIAPGVNYPLNLPEDIFDAQDPNLVERVYQATRWPIPYHDDVADPWPFTELDFHIVPGSEWPQAHIYPALGFVKAIDWVFSYMMGRIKVASRTFLITPKGLADDIKQRVLHGGDFELLDIESSHPGTMGAVITQFLQMPNVATDIWTVLAQLQRAYEDATGMTPLLMGYTTTQMRSAQEAATKQQNANMRPQDMAKTVENWQARICRKEAVAWRLYGDPAVVAKIFGEPYDPQGQQMGAYGTMPIIGPMTSAWMELVHTEDIGQALSDTEYNVESGSAREANQDAQIQGLDQGMQLVAPLMSQVYSQTGNSQPINGLFYEWAKLHGLDPEKFMVPDMSQQMQAMQAQQAQQAMQGAPPPDQQPPQLGVAG